MPTTLNGDSANKLDGSSLDFLRGLTYRHKLMILSLWREQPPEPVSGEYDYVGPLQLRGYQKVGRDFLFENKRAMLTDAPGLGKTAQSALAAVPPVLIACPKYLVDTWYEWLTGTDEKSMERNKGEVIPNVEGLVVNAVAYNATARFKRLRQQAAWTIVNHEMLRPGHAYDIMLGMAQAGEIQTLIIDESHHFKTWNAKQSKGAVELARDVERVYELTATPITREVDDLFNQLKILQPDIFTSYNRFLNTFCVVDYGMYGPNVLGVKQDMLPELTEMLDIVRLGRSYEQVGRELPPVIEKYVKIELPPEVRKIYDQVVNEYRNEYLEMKFLNYSQVMNHLRRIVTGSFKMDAVTEIINEEASWKAAADKAPSRAVVFSWYRDTAHNVAEAFGPGMFEVVTGEDAVKMRRQKALGSAHVSATIAALSEGIDLSDARTVVFAEENWTPGSNFQAKSRVVRERVGGDNTEPVILYYVMCARTVDEVIHRRARARSGTIKEVIHEALGI